jgi:hypothetical protein
MKSYVLPTNCQCRTSNSFSATTFRPSSGLTSNSDKISGKADSTLNSCEIKLSDPQNPLSRICIKHSDCYVAFQKWHWELIGRDGRVDIECGIPKVALGVNWQGRAFSGDVILLVP